MIPRKLSQLSVTALSAVLLYLTCSVSGQSTIRPVEDDDTERCEILNTTLLNADLCAGINYTSVHLPNLRGQNTQAYALAELEDFTPVINCSVAFRTFLCSFYLPLCFPDPINNNAPVLLKPCRSVCEYVRPPCEEAIRIEAVRFPIFANMSSFWPSQFNCSDESLFGEPPTCFAFQDIGTLPPTTTRGIETTTASQAPETTTTRSTVSASTPTSGDIPNGAPSCLVTMVMCILGVLIRFHI